MRWIVLFPIPFLVACSLLQPRVDSTPPPAPSTQAVPTSAPLPEPAPTAAPTQGPAASLPDPSGYAWTPVIERLESPVDLQNAGDERLFVVEQRGVIRAFDSGSQASTYLDIAERVGDRGNEQGLLGLAFHPDFATNGYLFVNYTDNNGDTVIARFQDLPDGSAADPASEHTILTYGQPYPNHNGGGLAFGPDGMLYIGAGDGGSAGDPEERAQNPDTLLGKLLRIDVTNGDPYAIPADNPFAAGGGRPEIWALGLRNPWRFAFDPQTGDLYIADVGQDDWEEVTFLPGGSPGGANLGWDFREGFESFEGLTPGGLTDPVAVYSHDEGNTIIGGVVVRDPALPAWNGVYLYGDFGSGRIWGLLRGADGAWQNAPLFDTGFLITSFGVGADGGVYVVDRGGAVYRLVAGG